LSVDALSFLTPFPLTISIGCEVDVGMSVVNLFNEIDPSSGKLFITPLAEPPAQPVKLKEAVFRFRKKCLLITAGD
jgi:hypothetical protein